MADDPAATGSFIGVNADATVNDPTATGTGNVLDANANATAAGPNGSLIVIDANATTPGGASNGAVTVDASANNLAGTDSFVDASVNAGNSLNTSDSGGSLVERGRQLGWWQRQRRLQQLVDVNVDTSSAGGNDSGGGNGPSVSVGGISISLP